MVQLFLSEPLWNSGNKNDESYMRIRSLLDELESLIRSIISSSGRSEARLWLCNALSSISSIRPRDQQDLFVSLLSSRRTKWHLAPQILRLVFEKWPHKVGLIIATKSQKLESLFKGNPKRVMDWFSDFSSSGDHGKGAKALSQFAFLNRDTCWEELEWKGKHGQSPAMVATKPHYFLDLDVQKTVDNFLEYVPEFWSSREFSESLEDGTILSIDTQFFVDMFMELMYKEEREEVWDVTREFLLDQPFSYLCHHLLIILDEQGLRLFLDLIANYLEPKSKAVVIKNATEWFEIILSKYCSSSTIDELILLSAVGNNGRHLLRLLEEEGSDEEKEKIKKLVFQILESSVCADNLAPIVEDVLNSNLLKAITKLAILSWAIRYKLSEEVLTSESWESLFIANGIKFRKSDKYALLHDDEISQDSGSDDERRSSAIIKSKRRRKHKKKRKREFDLDESFEDELVDSEASTYRDRQSKASEWLLATDGFSTPWNTADLPEHLSKHCFLSWLEFVFGKLKVLS